MKKVFAIFAIAVAMVACNNDASTADKEKATADSIHLADSLKADEAMKMAPAPLDTTKSAIDSTAGKMSADSTKK